MLAGGRTFRHVMALSLLAALTATLLAAAYLAIIYSQDARGLAIPRVRFVETFTLAIGLACAAGALTPWTQIRIALLAGATVGLLLMFAIGLLSIGLFYLAPAALAGMAIARIDRAQRGMSSVLAAAGGAALACAAVATGLSLFSLG